MIFPKIKLDDFFLKSKQVLFFYEIPILFVCEYVDDESFLVYCSDIDELHYSIALVKNETLVEMLENKVPMDSLFTEASKKWLANVVLFNEVCVAQRVEFFEENALPQKGALYGRLDESVQEFLLNLTSEIILQKIKHSIKTRNLMSATCIMSPYLRSVKKTIRFEQNEDYPWRIILGEDKPRKKTLLFTNESYKKEDILCRI